MRESADGDGDTSHPALYAPHLLCAPLRFPFSRPLFLCSGVLLKPVTSFKVLNAKTLKAVTGWLVAYMLAGSV